MLRIDAWDEIGEARVALVRRMTGRDPRTGEVRWSAPFELPEDYIEQHADLAYAGNVHVAEGRTVDTAHLVVDETAGRESLLCRHEPRPRAQHRLRRDRTRPGR